MIVQIIDLLSTFALLPTTLLAIKAFLTKKSLTPKLDRFFIELFWFDLVIGFVTGAILYHHHFVDVCGAIYLTAWRILVNWARIHPYIPSAGEIQKMEAKKRQKKAEKEADEVIRQVVPQMKRIDSTSTLLRVPYRQEISEAALSVLTLRFADRGWSLTVDKTPVGIQMLELKKKA
jgi:hypothetical protein